MSQTMKLYVSNHEAICLEPYSSVPQIIKLYLSNQHLHFIAFAEHADLTRLNFRQARAFESEGYRLRTEIRFKSERFEN